MRVTDCHLTPPSLSADNLLQFTDEPPFVLAKDLIGPDIGYPQPFWPLDRLISEGSRHTLRLLRGCNPGGVQSCKQPTCYYFLQAYRSTLSVIFRVPFIVIGASRNDLNTCILLDRNKANSFRLGFSSTIKYFYILF